MKIVISNYNDGQVVSYNVVVLKGSILNEDEIEQETNSLGRSLSQESCSSTSSDSSRWNISSRAVNPNLTIQAFLKNFDRHEKVELSVKIVRNRFILLVELSEGVNCVFFQDDSGRIVKEFRIKFLPSSNNCYVKPLYIFCVDSLPERVDDEVWLLNQRKIHVGLKLVQTLFAEKLFEWGLSRRTFALGDDAFSCEILQIPYTTVQIKELETKHLWDLLAREIRSNDRIWDENCKYVAFMADPWKPQRKEKLENSPALAGGGLALMGSDFLQVWPDQIQHVLQCLADESPIDVANFTFGSFSRNVGSLFSASLGGVAHEMSHCFDLGHTEGGLMGNQYHRVDLCLSPLVSYPKAVVQVSSTDEERQIRPKVCLPNGHVVEDCVSLSFSCATLLFFHRWFRSTPSGVSFQQNGPILTKNTITSQVGLTVIEIRDLDNGSILKSWTFDRLKIRYEFHLGKSTIPSDQHVVDVVAQDFHGCILKIGIDRNSLPESFTHLRRRNT